MIKRIIPGVLAPMLAAAFIAGCQSQGTAPEATTEHGGFGDTTSRSPDPGLDGRDPRAGGVEDSSGGLETIYFAFDDHGLSGEAKRQLKQNASVVQRNGAGLEIQGNCDERGTAEYNLALGKRRAESARRYLVDLGVDPRRISTVSFGEENPAVVGSSESAWARNRRADFVLR